MMNKRVCFTLIASIVLVPRLPARAVAQMQGPGSQSVGPEAFKRAILGRYVHNPRLIPPLERKGLHLRIGGCSRTDLCQIQEWTLRRRPALSLRSTLSRLHRQRVYNQDRCSISEERRCEL